MPSPLQLLINPTSLVVISLYGALILWEHLFPARILPLSRLWRLRGLIAFVVFFFLSSYLPLLWSEHLQAAQLVDLTHLGTWAGAGVGLLVYEAGVYAWHRGMHASDVLWRGLHQMHHSAERLDTWGAFWFSPLDMVGWTALSSLCLTLVVGIAPEAATLVLYATTFMAVFQHANIRTPRWLGYFLQRPESHSVHHQRGVHAYNYSDLPLFDLLFGTFRNPRAHAPEQGFYDGASLRVPGMLAFRDVSQPGTAGAGASAAAAGAERS
ncbi:sterol desaturase family protein [Coralloluteibacterium stylophorae]|uniref:Sterol desaturase family protein n=1 Tax=Coralloluteibacterium stylophorae TaxID=1776034 RepID=A0A8J7VR38_9GAMM|nr:sterol desaturase family protein [Coralloluteibacterium stylophorae]MBS7456946.1 sterol desaturase family protein [Coralloluteibacterium stylophorae]